MENLQFYTEEKAFQHNYPQPPLLGVVEICPGRNSKVLLQIWRKTFDLGSDSKI